MKNSLFLLSTLILLSSCGSKPSSSSNDIVLELQKETTDTSALVDLLEDELEFRALDSARHDGKVVVVKDSFLRIDDTMRWEVISRVLEADSLMKPFPTDSVRKALKNMMKVIYPDGEGGPLDNRQDWYELAEESPYRNTSEQTVCLMRRNLFLKRPDGSYELRTRKFTEARRLCSVERFSNQPVGGFCSGFAVTERLIVTAGHCVVSSNNLKDFFVVFNFRQLDSKTTNQVFTQNEIYIPVAIVQRALDESGHDFAVLRVDHAIPSRRIAPVRETEVAVNEKVFVMGHPCGLPLKVADRARVLNNGFPTHFLANVDTYGGNSGSPVYDSLHRIVGILVRGATDFEYNNSKDCYQSHVCLEDLSDCGGESVSRSSQFIPYIQGARLRR